MGTGRGPSWVVAAGWSLLGFPWFPNVHAAADEKVIDRLLILGVLASEILICRGRMAARAAVVALVVIWAFDWTAGIFAFRRFYARRNLSLAAQARLAIEALLLAASLGVELAPKLPKIEPLTLKDEIASLRGFIDEIVNGLREETNASTCNPRREQCLVQSNDALDYGSESW